MLGEDELDRQPGGETGAALRARVLLGLLAEEEAAALALGAGRPEAQAMAREFRTTFGLLAPDELARFLAAAGLGLADFSAVMSTFGKVAAVQTRLAAAIRTGLPGYLGLARLVGGGGER
jgi:hypothetical protein